MTPQRAKDLLDAIKDFRQSIEEHGVWPADSKPALDALSEIVRRLHADEWQKLRRWEFLSDALRTRRLLPDHRVNDSFHELTAQAEKTFLPYMI